MSKGHLLTVAVTTIMLRLMGNVFLNLHSYTHTIINHISQIGIIIINISLENLISRISNLVTITTRNVNGVIRAYMRHVLLILSLDGHVLHYDRTLNEQEYNHNVNYHLHHVNHTIGLIVNVLNNEGRHTIGQLRTLRYQPLLTLLNDTLRLRQHLRYMLVLNSRTHLRIINMIHRHKRGHRTGRR